MKQFKIGDQVKCINGVEFGDAHTPAKGETYVVTYTDGIYLSFHEGAEAGWWSHERFELAGFAAGERVRISDDPYYTLDGRRHEVSFYAGREGVIRDDEDCPMVDKDGDYVVKLDNGSSSARISPACLTRVPAKVEPQAFRVVSNDGGCYHYFEIGTTVYLIDGPQTDDLLLYSTDPDYQGDDCKQEGGKAVAQWMNASDLEPLDLDADFEVGDRLIVTGDTAGYHHSFDAGTEVTVIETGREITGHYNSDSRGYRVQTDDSDGIHGHDMWDVEHADLRLVFRPEPEAVEQVEAPVFEKGDVVRVVSRATFYPFDSTEPSYHDTFGSFEDRPKEGDILTVRGDQGERNVVVEDSWLLGKDCIEKVEAVPAPTFDFEPLADWERELYLAVDGDALYIPDDWTELGYITEDGEPDMVEHPQHYMQHPSGLEIIEITRHHNFAIGSALKYIFRHPHKGKPVEDLRKAIQYLEFEIEDIEAGNREVAA